MAFVHIDHDPETIGMCLPLNLILPDPSVLRTRAPICGSERAS